MATAQELQAYVDKIWAAVPTEAQEAIRGDYSRLSDSMRTELTNLQTQQAALEDTRVKLEGWRTQLRGWATTKEQELIERERRLGATPPPTTPNPNPNQPPPATPPANQPPDVVTREDMGKVLNRFGTDLLVSNSEIFKLYQRHQQLYGNQRLFDPEELFRHPKVMELGATGAFEDLHKEAIAAAAVKAKADDEARIRADERQKVIAEVGTNKNLPYPTPGEDDSPMGILERRQKAGEKNGEQYGVLAAVEEYHRMQAAKQLPG